MPHGTQTHVGLIATAGRCWLPLNTQQDEADQEAQEQLCQRLAALAAYQHLQRGNVHAALDIAAHYCPTVLEVGRCFCVVSV